MADTATATLALPPTLTPSDHQTSLLGVCAGLVADLNDRWRVIDDPLQWILQHREGKRWRDRSFCRSRSGLQRCVREYSGPVDCVALLQIEALPEWHA